MNSPHTPLCHLVSLYGTSLWCPALHYTIIIIQHYILSCPTLHYHVPPIAMANHWRKTDGETDSRQCVMLVLYKLSQYLEHPATTYFLTSWRAFVFFLDIFKNEELCVHLFLAYLYRWPQFSTENFSKRTFQFFQSSLFQLCLCFCFAKQTSFLHFSLHFF